MLPLAIHFFGLNLGRQQPQTIALIPWIHAACIALPLLFWLLHVVTRPSAAEWEAYEKTEAAHNAMWDKIEARAIERDIRSEEKENKRRALSFRLVKPAEFRPVYDPQDTQRHYTGDEEDEREQEPS